MSSGPPPPPEPPRSTADIHLTGLTGALTLIALLVLDDTVFRTSGPPADIMFTLSPVVSYLVSVITGRLTRRHLQAPSGGPQQPPATNEPGPAPAGPPRAS